MKQLIQNISNGSSTILNAPTRISPPDHTLLISTSTTLISSGTERMLVNFGKSSWLAKARQQPEKVKMVLEKIKTDGLIPTVEAVRSKLAQPLALGYCHAGIVDQVGSGVSGFKKGDRVISNGAHADVVMVGQNLCVKIPDKVKDEAAVFTVVASIGLQGVRLASPSLGESVAVIGAGLIGLLTIQLLKAHGCRVLAIDLDDSKLALAKEFGAEICNPSKGEDPVAAGMVFSRGKGIDAVIITASAQSSEPVRQAALMSRKRGRIILVGVTGLELNRSDFYEKELTFQVSCSYGPGRYDPAYENQGMDYPIGYVRWTEQRNFEAVLDLMAGGQLNVIPLISHQFNFEEAESAYEVLTENKSSLGILLHYHSPIPDRYVTSVELRQSEFIPEKPILGFIGAGNYASRVLIPHFKAAKAQCHTLVTSGGVNAVIHGKKAGFLHASTDIDSIITDKEINTIIIATRHDTHAQLVVKALAAGKNVFVEKPLAIHLEELAEVEAAWHTANMAGKEARLMVGFNRRFSLHIQKMKALLEPIKEPKSFIMTINAGSIPSEHWTQDPSIGGGRIIGEACHFIDLMRFLTDCEIVSVSACCMGHSPGLAVSSDKATITLQFADGSFGTIHYLANGHSAFPKERVEVFAAGRILQLDNFRKLKGFGWPGFNKMNLWRQDKGQQQCVNQFLSALEEGRESPIPFQEIIEVARITIEAAEKICEA